MRSPVVLFDLDGTVLTPAREGGDARAAEPGPGRASMGRASRAICGEDHTVGLRFAGGTDRAIARAILARANMPFDEANVARLLDAYLRELARELEHRSYRPIGDVAFAVEALAATGACVGIATGNVREGARLKLTSAGLGEVFALERGGYGCDHELRPEVVRAAIARCGGGDVVVVVGDTEHDVTAARAVSAKVVGVAVNEASRRELEAAGADRIVSACGAALVEAIAAVC